MLGCASLALGVVTACGDSGQAPSEAHPPDAAAAAVGCRERWQQVAGSLAGRDQQVNPSDLAERWTSVLATAQYYATSATAGDCGATLRAAQDTIGRIQDWSAKLRRYDVPSRFGALAPVATDYLLAPLPSPRRDHGTVERPPTKAQVRRALTTLQDSATLATTDMQAGWDEADAVDLTDQAAVRRTLADLDFLAGDSTPFQQCAGALAVLERAQSFRS